jgi:hypothetical protein
VILATPFSRDILGNHAGALFLNYAQSGAAFIACLECLLPMHHGSLFVFRDKASHFWSLTVAVTPYLESQEPFFRRAQREKQSLLARALPQLSSSVS